MMVDCILEFSQSKLLFLNGDFNPSGCCLECPVKKRVSWLDALPLEHQFCLRIENTI